MTSRRGGPFPKGDKAVTLVAVTVGYPTLGFITESWMVHFKGVCFVTAQ